MRRPSLLVTLGLAGPALLLSTIMGGCPGTSTGTTSGGTFFNLPPTVVLRVTPDPAIGVAPFTVEFDSSDSADDGVIVSRSWNFGDGETSQDVSPTHIFQTNGLFTVRLTLTDDGGLRASRSIFVRVTERPVAVLGVDRDSADSAPASFNFDASASFDPDGATGDVLQYRWDFGDGSSESLPIVPHTYGRAGEYRVILTVTDASGVTGTAERIIQVGIPRPTLSFRTPPAWVNNVVCAPTSPLWVHVVFSVEPLVPYTLRAGLDLDTNATNGNDAAQLDTDARDGIMVNDLELVLPTALDLNVLPAIPVGLYYLWVEIRTDRTAPARTYAAAPVHIITPYTTAVTGDTPGLPLLNLGAEDWSVVLPPRSKVASSSKRQVFSLGTLNTGDRINLSLLDQPGFGDVFTYDYRYSLMILDAQQRLYAWYDSNFALFSPYSRLIVGHTSQNYYVVLDSTSDVPSVHVSLDRGVNIGPDRRRLNIYLNFAGTGLVPISVQGSPLFLLPPLALTGFNATEIEQLEAAIAARVQALLPGGSYDVVVSSSIGGVAAPSEPHHTIYFDNVNALPSATFYGAANFLDPRNQTSTGLAVISMDRIRADFPALDTPAETVSFARAIGNAVVHQIGFLVGLRETTGAPADIMTSDESRVVFDLNFTVADLAASSPFTAIGVQDAPMLLSELFGN